MQFRNLAALITLLAASLSPWGAAAQTPYTNAQYHFAVTPPAGWAVKQNTGAVVVFAEPVAEQASTASRGKETTKQFLDRINRDLRQGSGAARPFRANITVTAAPARVATAAEYAKVTRAKAAGQKIYKILSEKTIQLGGQPAIDRTIQLTLDRSAPMRTREVFCVRGGQVLTLIAAGSQTGFPQVSALFDKFLTSFVWK